MFNLKKIDIFTRPYFFYLDKDSKKRGTQLGGICSIIVLILVFLYLGYLLPMYLNNEIEPKISHVENILDTYNGIQLEEDSLVFQYMIGSIPLSQYQQLVGKTYLQYEVYHYIWNDDGTSERYKIGLEQCANEKFKNFFCLKKVDIENKQVYNFVQKSISSNLQLFINFCKGLTNCASQNEVIDMISNLKNTFITYTKTKQYNLKEKAFTDSFRQEIYSFDTQIAAVTRLQMIRSTTQVTSGLIIQDQKYYDCIQNVKRQDVTFSREGLQKKLGNDLMYAIQLEMNQITYEISIQYSPITEGLAQFNSVFNMLLLIGFFVSFYAERAIKSDMINILMKNYYRKTAFLLNTQSKSQKIISKDTEQQKLIEANKRISLIDFSSFIKKLFKGKSNSIEERMYNQLEKNQKRQQNIFSFFRDILFLKKAVKLLLTKEQYAAIHYCGSQLLIEENNQIEQKTRMKVNNQAKQNNQNNQELLQTMQKDKLNIEDPNSTGKFFFKDNPRKRKSIQKSNRCNHLQNRQENQLKNKQKLQLESDDSLPHIFKQNNQSSFDKNRRIFELSQCSQLQQSKGDRSLQKIWRPSISSKNSELDSDENVDDSNNNDNNSISCQNDLSFQFHRQNNRSPSNHFIEYDLIDQNENIQKEISSIIPIRNKFNRQQVFRNKQKDL